MLLTPRAPILAPHPLVTPLPRKLPISLHPSCVLALLPQNDPKWFDYSGHGNHGTVHGATPTAKGKDGFAWEFKGVPGHINIPLNGFPDPMANITVALRAKPDIIPVGATIFHTLPVNAKNQCLLALPWARATITWDFGDSEAGGRLAASWNTAWDNVWAQWMGTSERGIGQKIYRDSVLLASAHTWSTFSPGTLTLNIGSDVSPFWKGFIDCILIYNQAWSPRPQDANYLPEIDPHLT